MSVPAAILEGLDEQQARAALHRTGPSLVVAGAGAGKTTTLVRRIAALVASGVEPGSILVLSFTRASANAILTRARGYEPKARDVVGGTFHSVANRIVREHHRTFGLAQDFSLLDPEDAESLVKRIAVEVETSRHRPMASSLCKMISFARNTQSDLGQVIADRYPAHVEMTEWIEEVASRYVEEKRRQSVLDYDDLLEFWARLCEHPVAGQAVRERFRHVFVDEHQDSNAIQLRILYAIGGDCEGDRSVMAVGDPSQSIYAFRGAAPGTMFDFRRQWPATTTYLIERNYRSVPEIVSAADRIDRSMSERFERKLRSTRESAGNRITINTVAGPDEESEIVADLVLDKVEEGVPLHEQAVLVRSMRKARGIELRLKERGIPYVVVGGVKIHEAAHVKDVLAPLRIAVNPLDEGSWIRLLTLFGGVGPKTAAKFATACAGSDLERATAEFRDLVLRKPQLAPAVLALDAATLSAPNEALAGVRSALNSVMKHRYPEDWDSRKKDVDGIVDLAAIYADVGEFLQTITLDVAIDKRVEGGSRSDDERPLTLSTIHGSKGLEWSFVVVPSFVQGHLPSAFAETPEDMDEERRLFYVATTRAKDELFFFRPATTMVKGVSMPVQSSPFEAVLGPDVSRASLGVRAPAPAVRIEIPDTLRIQGW